MMTSHKKEFKYQMLERRAREIISEYSDKLTVRQIYYRLVANNDIPNKLSQYNSFDRVLVKARIKDFNLAERIEDRTRTIVNNAELDFPNKFFSQTISDKLTSIKTDYPSFYYSKTALQEKITLILLEKQALESIFKNVIGSTSILIVARGFNSFTQMYDLHKLLKNDFREKNLYIFTDFDDSGLLIEENFVRQMKEHLHIVFDNIERIALTEELIKKYDLPINPTKPSTHSKKSLPYFVELDALDPNILKELIKQCCNANYDQELYNSIQKPLRIRNRRLKKQYFRKLKKVDFSS